MAVRLTRAWGFNPGFGMQTTNVEAGTETIYHCILGAPVQRAGAPAVAGITDGDSLLLLKTKTSNRITRLELWKNAAIDFRISFFFAFIKDGKVKFPKYSTNAERNNSCFFSLACSVANDGNTPGGMAVGGNDTYVDFWRRMADNANDGAGGTKAHIQRVVAGAGNAIRPQLEPNIGSIMDKTLRARPGERGADDVNPDGLSEMSPIDTDAIICANITGNNIPAAQADKILVKIGIIETDISARNETEEYVKSWNQIPVQGVFDGDGVTLPYAP